MPGIRHVLAVLACLAQPAAAWEARLADDGALFYGVAEGPSGMTMACIGPSRRGVPAIQVGAHETAQTPPFALRLEFAADWLPGNGVPPERRDVVIWADGTGYRLPLARFNEMHGVWMADVAMTDRLVTAMGGAETLLIGAERDQQFALSTAGIAQALDTVMSFCVAEYRRMGLAVPPALEALAPPPVPTPAPAAAGTMARAEAAILQGCEGAGTRTPGAILTGDMDGDGAPDAVLDWNEVTCTSGMARPFCGAAVCSVDFFLSTRPAPPGANHTALGAGPALVPLSNGTMGVRTGTAPATCNSTGTCAVIWYWNGNAMATLPQ